MHLWRKGGVQTNAQRKTLASLVYTGGAVCRASSTYQISYVKRHEIGSSCDEPDLIRCASRPAHLSRRWLKPE
jgi:hypothetical protein